MLPKRLVPISCQVCAFARPTCHGFFTTHARNCWHTLVVASSCNKAGGAGGATNKASLVVHIGRVKDSNAASTVRCEENVTSYTRAPRFERGDCVQGSRVSVTQKVDIQSNRFEGIQPRQKQPRVRRRHMWQQKSRKENRQNSP